MEMVGARGGLLGDVLVVVLEPVSHHFVDFVDFSEGT
jgi:hypothetical protein